MPWQYEFARLNLTYTVMSKRLLKRLVEEGHVSGWDDPRMPTVAGMRRRGYTPAAIRRFAERIGVSRRDSIVDVGLLEHALREDLNATSPRTMAVLRPLKLVIENLPEGQEEIELDAPFSPNDDSFGSRTLHLTREVFIERDDFMEEPMKKWFRLAPGREVRLAVRGAGDLQRSRQGRRGQCRRAPLHLGPGLQRRQRARRSQSARHHPLGQREARRRCRGASLRPALQTMKTRSTKRTRATSPTRINPESLEVLQHAKLEPNLACARTWRTRPVRTLRLFRGRPRQHPRPPRLQPHHPTQRLLVQTSQEKIAARKRGQSPFSKG